MTTDNGSNMVCALESRLKWPHLSCFGHNLHLAVTNSIKDDSRVQRALGVCRKIVSTFSYSWKKRRELSEAQKTLNLPDHSLKSDCTTRWGSMRRILEQKEAIKQVLHSDPKTRHLCLTWQDLDVLESVRSGLNSLDEFADSLSGESEVTVSAINAVLHILKTDVLAIDEEKDTTLTRDIKEKIVEYMEKKYESLDVVMLLCKASYLDPRFCLSYLHDQDGVTAAILVEGIAILDQHADSHSDIEKSAENAMRPPASKKRKHLGSWLAKAQTHPNPQQNNSQQEPEEKMKVEMEKYEKSPRADPYSDQLQWWSIHYCEFPTLSTLAKKYLCV